MEPVEHSPPIHKRAAGACVRCFSLSLSLSLSLSVLSLSLSLSSDTPYHHSTSREKSAGNTHICTHTYTYTQTHTQHYIYIYISRGNRQCGRTSACSSKVLLLTLLLHALLTLLLHAAGGVSQKGGEQDTAREELGAGRGPNQTASNQTSLLRRPWFMASITSVSLYITIYVS